MGVGQAEIQNGEFTIHVQEGVSVSDPARASSYGSGPSNDVENRLLPQRCPVNLTNSVAPLRRLRAIPVAVFLSLLSAACNPTVRNAGQAMSPTINDGERVVITRAVQPLRRGDIVVFYYPADRSMIFIKRVVGLPGETIAIAAGGVAINGKPVDEPYVSPENRSSDTFGPMAIRPGEYFVMGDNRRNSSDSRHWGAVPESLIRGKALASR